MLSDESSILGVEKNESTNVIRKENLLDLNSQIISYDAHQDTVYTILPNEARGTFLSGESNNDEGKVIEFDLQTGAIVKDYGPVGVKAVLSNARLGNLCFFGGWDSGRFAVLDTRTKQVLMHPVATSVKNIDSLAVCEVRDLSGQLKVLLAVSGRVYELSDDTANLFDITQLIYKFGEKTQAQPKTDKLDWNLVTESHVLDIESRESSLARVPLDKLQNDIKRVKLENSELQRVVTELRQQLQKASLDNKLATAKLDDIRNQKLELIPTHSKLLGKRSRPCLRESGNSARALEIEFKSDPLKVKRG